MAGSGRPPGPGRGIRTPTGNGAGYGGPAKGGEAAGMARINPRAHTSEAIANKAARAEKLIERLETLAESAAREADQIQAALGALKHLAPDANTTHRDDLAKLSDAELDAEIARREGALSAVAQGEGSTVDPPVAH